MRAVNQEDTLCDDGLAAEECYVAEIDWRRAGYSTAEIERAEGAEGGTIVEGRIVTGAVGGIPIGVFEASAAWVAEWGTALAPAERRRTFHQLADTGVACFVDPCFNIDLEVLNTGARSTASGLDLSRTGASTAQQMAGGRALDDGTLRAAGALVTDAEPGPAGAFGETYVAAQFYLPL